MPKVSKRGGFSDRNSIKPENSIYKGSFVISLIVMVVAVLFLRGRLLPN